MPPFSSHTRVRSSGRSSVRSSVRSAFRFPGSFPSGDKRPALAPFEDPSRPGFPDLGYGPRPHTPVRRARKSPMALWRRLKAPVAFWALTISVAVVTARMVERAAAPFPAEWGTLVDVVVATQPLAAGEPIDASSVVVRSIPSAFVPDRATSRVNVAVGRTLLDALSVGSPVNLARTVPASTSATVASVGKGRRGIGLPVDAIPPGLKSGDHVDVLVASDGDGSLVGTVRNAQVVVLDERGALVAMATADAERITAARVIGRATLTIVGG